MERAYATTAADRRPTVSVPFFVHSSFLLFGIHYSCHSPLSGAALFRVRLVQLFTQPALSSVTRSPSLSLQLQFAPPSFLRIDAGREWRCVIAGRWPGLQGGGM